MAKRVKPLTVTEVKNFKTPGMHADGNGLYLKVQNPTAKYWILRYKFGDKRHDMGLGSFPDVTLLKAREIAAEQRELLRDGINPIRFREEEKEQQRKEELRNITFQDCALQYIEAHRPTWKNAKHAAQWLSTLEAHAFPVFADKPVGDVNKDDIVKALKPIWKSRTETATRVRSRIERILDWATAHDLRTGDNPARGKGFIHTILGDPTKLKKGGHHKALDYKRVAEFVAWLQSKGGTSALAFEFTILTAARSGEVYGARWNEIDFDEKTWTVPPERTKTNKEHIVPLTDRMLEILETMQAQRRDSFIFPGNKENKGMSGMTMLILLKRSEEEMQWGGITVHGFRSTFKDWAADCTDYPNELSEMALGHAIGNKVEAAYRRKTMLEKRRDMMKKWDAFCINQNNHNT